MDLKSITYTSLASIDLAADDLADIHASARKLNALDGITGLLIFNGTHFLQIVEGAGPAIDELLLRLRRDRRHSGLEVRDERAIDRRSFPDWSMELVRVDSGYATARDTINETIPRTVDGAVRDRIQRMTEVISVSI
jgi:hypothetical protein